MTQPHFLISKYGDLLFALGVGLTAGILRIREEESLKRVGLPSSSMVLSPAQKARIADLRSYHEQPSHSSSRPETFADLRKGYSFKRNSLGQQHQSYNTIGRSRLDPADKIPLLEILSLYQNRVSEALHQWWQTKSAAMTVTR